MPDCRARWCRNVPLGTAGGPLKNTDIAVGGDSSRRSNDENQVDRRLESPPPIKSTKNQYFFNGLLLLLGKRGSHVQLLLDGEIDHVWLPRRIVASRDFNNWPNVKLAGGTDDLSQPAVIQLDVGTDRKQ